MKSEKIKAALDKRKAKGLFDHINHIRETKSVDYYTKLTDDEKKSFNKYMIIRILSMDKSLIEAMAIISKYFQIIPEEQFYKLLIDIVPKGRKFCKYIKKSTESVNEIIIKCICDKFAIGQKDAEDYYRILISHDEGIKELISLIEGFGFSEKEVEKMFK